MQPESLKQNLEAITAPVGEADSCHVHGLNGVEQDVKSQDTAGAHTAHGTAHAAECSDIPTAQMGPDPLGGALGQAGISEAGSADMAGPPAAAAAAAGTRPKAGAKVQARLAALWGVAAPKVPAGGWKDLGQGAYVGYWPRAVPQEQAQRMMTAMKVGGPSARPRYASRATAGQSCGPVTAVQLSSLLFAYTSNPDLAHLWVHANTWHPTSHASPCNDR